MDTTTGDTDQMRRPAKEWMVNRDDRLLEAIRDEGNMTPRAISRAGDVPRVDVSRKHAGRRLRTLAEWGIVCYLDRGLFGLTNIGEAYLNEELDANKLERVDDPYVREYDLDSLDAYEP